MKTEQIYLEIENTINNSRINNFDELWTTIGQVFEKQITSEYIFYFEKDDLLPEINLSHGNQKARELEQESFFYQIRALVYDHLDKEPQIYHKTISPFLEIKFKSAVFYPIQFSEGLKGIWVLIRTQSNQRYTTKDFNLIDHVFSVCFPLLENLKLKRIVSIYQKEQKLITRLNKLIDSNYYLTQFLKYLIEIIEQSIDCSIVIFLLYDEISGHYRLEAGNATGCEFWANQEDFFRSLAIQAEEQGTFARCYSGKYFRGEKYGLDRFETSLVLPLNFYEKTLGSFVLLNKNNQKNFTELDVKFMNIIIRNSKAVIFREKEKNSIVSHFKRFVSDRIVREILENPNNEFLKEERRNISVLFIDLNDFTALSEKLPPNDLIIQLNEFLSAMTELVFEYEGMLDKYIGDEIMAIFGSLGEVSNHAVRAVECAFAMQQKMAALQNYWTGLNQEPLSASIGICTGPAVVGAIGCDKYMDYTAIGNTVNIASRLTSIADDGCILISEPTYFEVSDMVHSIPMENVILKGYEKSASCYYITDLKNEKELTTALSTAEPQKQARILSKLGEFWKYKNSDLAISYLSSPVLEVRVAAVGTVRTLNREKDIDHLIEHLSEEDNPHLKKTILDTISNISSETVITLLRDYLGEIEPKLQSKVIRSIGYSGKKENRRLLLPLLNDTNHEVRANVAHALYRFGDESIIEVLIKMLKSRDIEMKISAIDVLGKIGTTQVANPLIKALQIENNEQVKLAIARAIGSFKRPRTLKFAKYLFLETEATKEWAYLINAKEESEEKALGLFRKALSSFNSYLIYATLFALRDCNIHGLGPELIEILKSERPLLQIEAIYGLREYPNGLVIPVFLDILEELDINVQKEVLKELAFRQQHQLLHVLHRYLDSSDPDLITTAVIAISILRNEQSLIQLISKYYDTDNANLQATIIRALGNFQGEKMIPILLDGLKSPIGRIRANAIDSLIQKKYDQSMPLIEPLLQDQNNRVRANAALALWKFGNQNIWKFMEDMISSTDKWMRLSAIWALGEVGGEDSLNLIMKHMDDTDYDVKLRAILTVNRMDRNLLELLGNMLDAKDADNETAT